MKTVMIAGATGYAGRHLCAEFARRGWYVSALVRNTARARDLPTDTLVQAEATQPDTLNGVMAGVDLVVSALGITRQTDGLGYREVDLQANLNLLRAAERSDVGRFAYLHVLHADRLQRSAMVQAKSAFAGALRASPLPGTVIAPSGYFSDMGAFLDMARRGRVWLFGDGQTRINPIHGADLAAATAQACEAGTEWRDIGGPDVLSQDQIAAMAFDALGKPSRITHLPDVFRRAALSALRFAPRHVSGPAEFFLSAMAMDMVGACCGAHRLSDHFAQLAGGAR